MPARDTFKPEAARSNAAPPSLSGHGFDFLNGFRAPGRSCRFVREQARSDSTLARQYLSAHSIYLGFARNHCIFQRVSRGLYTCRRLPQLERALGANFVLVSFHAIDHAAFSGCYRTAVLLDVFGAGALELRNPGRQLLQNRLPEVRLRGNGTNRKNDHQRQQSTLASNLTVTFIECPLVTGPDRAATQNRRRVSIRG